jgi:ATP-binding cassette subfamily B protein
MGLLSPTNGTLVVDGVCVTPDNARGWQRHIAHVPQAIFLADSSIVENIAFGVPREQIDYVRISQVVEQAQLMETIEKLPDGLKTMVGERGVRLSGGQRQRIGIARALYKNADVIVFDEATSALDNETEEAVMEAIESLSSELTILIIAHRLSTLRKCTQIVELSEGRIERIGMYKDIIDV